MRFFYSLTLSQAVAQLPTEVARVGYADTIFVNGKIVSMDDVSNSTEVGRIYQALAVKGERIMKLGTSEEVRPLAGPETKVLDLQGTTLIPGIIEPHSHIYGRVTSLLDRLGLRVPPQRGLMATTQAERSLEETQANIRDALKEAIQRARSR